ncbi:MAG: carboxypeptidase-like regulatory domain-containing protein [Bacteroidales bacterium]|nr:carboxypeptidase-like regulatory domain-containing protein [Bacteroidales bacterium]
MRFLFLTVLVLIILNSAKAQNYVQTISGTVFDKDSKETLIGATVVLVGSDLIIGTITDADGSFFLENVPVGRQTLMVSYIGYSDISIPEILVTTGKVVVLNIELSQNLMHLQEVQVIASESDKDKTLNTMSTISARKLNMEDASRYAGGFFDASRMVSSFAGVTAVEGDGVNDIIIRGNSSRGLLWKLEGIEIPNPNHFTDGQGGTGGTVSIISSKMLSTSDFFTGAFPAEYGNATSGIMDINLRTGKTGEREYAFQLGVVGTEFCLEGGFTKQSKSSYLINYRYSTFGYLSKMGMIDLGNNNLPPIFQDLSAKINFPTKKSGTFSLFIVAGQSNTGTQAIKDSTQWLSDPDLSYFENEDHKMAIAGLKHFYLFHGNKTSIKTVVAGTYQSDEWTEGSLTHNYEKFHDYYNIFTYPSIRASIVLNSKINNRNVLRAGIMFSSLGFDMFYRDYNFNIGTYDTLVNQNGYSSLSQAFIQHKYRFSDKTEMNIGIHTLYFQLNGNSSIEPRLGVKHKITDKVSLNFGFGMHSRAEAISAYMALIQQPDGEWSAVNKNIGFGKASHTVIGCDYSLNQNWRIKAEAYYQYLFNAAVSMDTTSVVSSINFGYGIPDQELINSGKGYNFGVELTVERFFNQGYYVLFTTSIFDSKFKAPNGNWYNTVFNCGYVGNFLAGKDFNFGNHHQNVVGINTKCVLRGGYRISPINRELSILDHEVVFDESRYNENRLPNFLRFDFGTYCRINKVNYSYIFSLDIQNFINRKNIMWYEYSASKNDIVPVEGMGLIPILNFRIEF